MRTGLRKLQCIRSRSIVNLTPFGQDLKRLFRSSVGTIIESHDCGWLDGGCWTLSHAVKQWIGDDAQLFCVLNTDNGQQQHVIVRLFNIDVYIDGDGLSRRDEMLRKMEILESCEYSMQIVPFDATREDMGLMRVDEDVVFKLKERLLARFGPWRNLATLVREITEE